ncbi:MAG: phosphotransferase [Clostridia bacterium]|nr:phosphotransferase [Clostridia bacterium]
MDIREILNYLVSKGVLNNIQTAEPVTLGQGGAKIYKIETNSKNYILKIAYLSLSCDENTMSSYRKELNFYRLNEKLKLPFVPKAFYCEEHPKYGILILLKCLNSVSHNEWNIELQKKAIDMVAKFNSLPIDLFEPIGIKWQPTVIDKNFSLEAYKDWVSVISEHEGKFDPKLLDAIYKNIYTVPSVLNTEPQYICHGDFHPENILSDGEELYMCDFQGLNIGKCAGDINFFISRGSSMGINIDSEKLLSYYAERLSQYTGKETDTETLEKERCASSLLVTFSFWADYLRNADFIKVKLHYDEMVNAAKFLDIL